MTARTAALRLTDDPVAIEEIVARIEAYADIDPEVVLSGVDARLEGIGLVGHEPSSRNVVRAVEKTLDALWGVGQNGSPRTEISTARTSETTDRQPSSLDAATRRIRRQGKTVALETTPLGGGRAIVLISRLDPPDRLLLDTALLGSAKERSRILEKLPEEVRAEAAPLLEDLALELLKANGLAHSKRDLQGSAVELKEVESWPDPVDGAELLDQVAKSIRRYVLMREEAAIAAALWTVHTHAFDAATVSPILAISSPVKRCGKTTLQGVLRRLVRRPLPASQITGPALFRMIAKYEPTMLLDEADSYLTQNEGMRNLLNAGVKRGDSHVYRVVGDDHEPRGFSVFAPKTIALIGKLPGTLEDRSIILRLERKRKAEKVERLRGRDAEEIFEPLRRKAARWATDNLEELRYLKPALPESLNDRAGDFWEPLLAIADLAGGSWPDRARRAAVALSGDEDPSDDSPSILLLSDLREFLATLEERRISSKDLAERLANLEERPWSTWSEGCPITQNQVARLLRRFDGVTSRTLRFSGGERAKGYAIESCQDAFDRYLPPLQVPENGEVLP